MIIKEVKLKPLIVEPPYYTFPTEQAQGLKWAVVYDDRSIIALFNDRYWAEKFIKNVSMAFTIREVAE